VPKHPPQFISLSCHILRRVNPKTVCWYNTSTSLRTVVMAWKFLCLCCHSVWKQKY